MNRTANLIIGTQAAVIAGCLGFVVWAATDEPTPLEEQYSAGELRVGLFKSELPDSVLEEVSMDAAHRIGSTLCALDAVYAGSGRSELQVHLKVATEERVTLRTVNTVAMVAGRGLCDV